MKKSLIIFILILSSKLHCQDMLGLSNIQVYSAPSKNKELDRTGGTLFLSSVNLTINTFNTMNFNDKKKKSNAGFGIITGLFQLSYGAMERNRDINISSIDISLGAATIVYSSIRLFKKERKNHEGKLSLTPYFFKSPLIGKVNGISLKLKF